MDLLSHLSYLRAAITKRPWQSLPYASRCESAYEDGLLDWSIAIIIAFNTYHQLHFLFSVFCSLPDYTSAIAIYPKQLGGTRNSSNGQLNWVSNYEDATTFLWVIVWAQKHPLVQGRVQG